MYSDTSLYAQSVNVIDRRSDGAAVTTHKSGNIIYLIASRKNDMGMRVLVTFSAIPEMSYNSDKFHHHSNVTFMLGKDGDSSQTLDVGDYLQIDQQVFIDHVMAINEQMLREEYPSGVPDAVTVRVTAQMYDELRYWGDTTAAKSAAKLFGVPIRTIHNRVRLARSRNIIPHVGMGVRKYKRVSTNV